MTGEIGSEFHRIPFEFGQGLIMPAFGSFVFSGRTAIETVLKEMPEARKAALPSYCCDSMIEPFKKAGIEVIFYPVNYEDRLRVEIPEDTNIILWCNYFGYRVEMPDLADFQNHGGILIEDITHSFFSDQQYHSQSTYLVASLRKWEPVICGGYCPSINGKLHYIPVDLPPQKFSELKASAMELKTDYLENPQLGKKEKFLSMYGECNHWLAENYSGLTMDSWSREYLSHVNMEEQKRIRRRNAGVLYEGLEGKTKFLFALEDMDCPLFVPILLENRDEIREYLTKNEIYCPVHWPRPKGCKSNLYDLELSLICDQRYGVEDMKRIVSVLSEVI